MAASVSYYAVLSLFPLVLGLSAIVGMVAQSPERQDDVIDFIVDYLPGSESFVKDSLDGVIRFRATLGIVSLLSLLWAGSAVFGAITRAVNRAWDVQQIPPFYKNKPRQLLMAVGIAFLFAISLGITSVFQWATSIELAGTNLEDLVGGAVVAGVLKIPAFAISLGIFAFVYKVLPNTKTYWSYIWPGAIVAALLFESGKNLFLLYLENFAGVRPAIRQHYLGDNPDGVGLFVRVHSHPRRRDFIRVRPDKARGWNEARPSTEASAETPLSPTYRRRTATVNRSKGAGYVLRPNRQTWSPVAPVTSTNSGSMNAHITRRVSD